MITLEQLIINELKYHAEHEPTQEEIHALSEHLGQVCTPKMQLVELDLAISGWCKLSLQECAWCGEKYLPSEMIHVHSGEHFCSCECKNDYKDEHGIQEGYEE
ncbi:MAG: hypothetical protein J6R99_03790 [Alphaproteobacteria bacterium]|nr:hypothetical protein [Alphaproteobacteria bacterium]